MGVRANFSIDNCGNFGEVAPLRTSWGGVAPSQGGPAGFPGEYAAGVMAFFEAIIPAAVGDEIADALTNSTPGICHRHRSTTGRWSPHAPNIKESTAT
jgi:hypothetical protein